MTILGIDPSTVSLGWALYENGVPERDGFFAPDKSSPLATLHSIMVFLNELREKEGEFDLVACERMFQSKFLGEPSAVLKVIPQQIAAWVAEGGAGSFLLLSPMIIKKVVGANALKKLNPKMKTKEAVYACVEQYMSEKAKALPKAHKYDVSDAHAIALTAIHQITHNTV